MSKNEKTLDEKVQEIEAGLDEGTAADSLHPGSNADNDPKTKTERISQMIGALGQIEDSQFVAIFNQVMSGANSKAFAANIPDGAAAQNAASVAMKGAVKEDVAAILEGQDLSEEFKSKTAVLFEAAVSARVAVEKIRLSEEADAKIDEALIGITESLVEKVDAYLDMQVEKWHDDNAVAIVPSLKAEITESFIESLRNVFVEHDIDIPEEKVDLVGGLVEKAETLETNLNKVIDENVELKKQIEKNTRDNAVAEVAQGLALTQVEKLKSLAETVDFTGDIEDFKKKVGFLKESTLVDGKDATKENLMEEVVTEDNTKVVPSSKDPMSRYASVIARTAKK